MKRIFIYLSGVAGSILLGLLLASRGCTDARLDRHAEADAPTSQPVAKARDAHEESESKRARTDSIPTVHAKPPAVKGTTERKIELAKAELGRRPELKAALDNNLRRFIRAAYGDLEKLLGVDRAAARRLVDLLCEQELVQKDAAVVMQERGIRPDDPEYDNLLRSFKRELDAEMRSILDDEKFKLLQLAPQVRQKERDLATYYEGEFREIDAPLSPDQSLQLAVVMARFPVSSYSNDPIQTDPGPGQYLRARSEIPMLEAAGNILTPAQLGVIKSRLVEQNMEEDFQRRLKESVSPASGSAQRR